MTYKKLNILQVCFVLALTFTLVQCELKLLIQHTNDMHSRFVETNAHSGQCVRGKCYGGFARLKGAVNRYKQEAEKEGRKVIFLNAGDTFQGSAYYTMFKWKVASELVNLLGIDALSFGNHEFDDGPQGLAPFVDNSTVPFVVSNIDYSNEPVFENDSKFKSIFSPSHVLTVDETKIGVIGYLTPDTKFLSKTGGVVFHDEVTSIKKEATKLKGQGVKILIAVGHSGFSVDKEIAEKVPDIDVVVGGHTNTFLYTGKAPDIEIPEGPYPTIVTQPSGRKVPVVQAYAYTKYLGHLKLTFNDDGEVTESSGNPILLDESFKKDPDMERAVLKYANQMKALEKRIIGTAKTFLEGDQTCRIRECNLGNLIADAMVDANSRDYAGKEGWTDASIALLNGGAVRASIDTGLSNGAISYADILTVMPFQNSVERIVLTGDILMQVLEHSVSKYSLEDRPGGFMQYSGVQIVYDLAKDPGDRVESVKIRCGDCKVPQYFPLDKAATYNALVTTFIADGGDGYDMLKNVKQRKTLSYMDVDAVMDYLNRTSPINPEISGRIILKNVEKVKNGAIRTQCLNILLICLFSLKLYVQ